MHDFTRLKIVVQHVLLLGVMALAMYGVYVYFQNPRSIVVTASALILAHLAVATGLFYAGRGLAVRLFRKMHGAKSEPPDDSNTLLG